jgi:hypothetical protein
MWAFSWVYPLMVARWLLMFQSSDSLTCVPWAEGTISSICLFLSRWKNFHRWFSKDFSPYKSLATMMHIPKTITDLENEINYDWIRLTQPLGVWRGIFTEHMRQGSVNKELGQMVVRCQPILPATSTVCFNYTFPFSFNKIILCHRKGKVEFIPYCHWEQDRHTLHEK